MAEAAGKAFYDRQIEYLEAQDVDKLISNQYHPNAKIISFDFVKQGHEELHAHFKDYLAHLGKIELKSTDKFVETEDSIFFEATVLTGAGEAKVYDVFMLEDGKATHHFTGLISFQPYDDASAG
jgi:hypothetical protein